MGKKATEARQVWNHDKLCWELNGVEQEYFNSDGNLPEPPEDEEEKRVLLTKVIRGLAKKGKAYITISYVHKLMSKEGLSKEAIDTIWANYKDGVVSNVFSELSMATYEITWGKSDEELTQIKELCSGDWPERPVKTTRRRTSESAQNAHLKQQLQARLKDATPKDKKKIEALLKRLDK